MSHGIGTAGGLSDGSLIRSWVTVGLMVALSSLPLIMSPEPMSIGLNNHFVRYIALADHLNARTLGGYYSFRSAIFPNLGMDIFESITVFIFGPEIGSKVVSALVVLALPSGFLVLVWCIHGRLRPIDCGAFVLLAYSHIFVWGFSNFLLGAGVALALFGLWIAHESRPNAQLMGAILGGMVLMFIHALSFGIWGILLAAFELGRWTRREDRLVRSLFVSIFRLFAVALAPVCYFLFSKTVDAPQGLLFFADNLQRYNEPSRLAERIIEEIVSRIDLIFTVADSGFRTLNLVIGITLVAVVLNSIFRGQTKLDERLTFPLVALVALWAFMPPNLYGSGYANDRIPLLLWSVGSASIHWSNKDVWAPLAMRITLLPGFTHYLVILLTYSIAGENYILFVRELTRGRTTSVAVTVLYSGVERVGLHSYCSAFEFLAFLNRKYAVQTFEYSSQQPIAARGVLREVVRRRSKAYSRW